MPNKDGTGPEGKGSKTGRQRGNCKDAEPQPYPRQRGLGQGLGNGRGTGRGRRCRNC